MRKYLTDPTELLEAIDDGLNDLIKDAYAAEGFGYMDTGVRKAFEKKLKRLVGLSRTLEESLDGLDNTKIKNEIQS